MQMFRKPVTSIIQVFCHLFSFKFVIKWKHDDNDPNFVLYNGFRKAILRKLDHCKQQGDRAGVCVTQFDPKQLERGLVCTPGALPTISAAIISVKKIPYYKGPVNTKAKFHITVGHETVMGRATFFGLYEHKSNEPDTTTGTIKKICILLHIRCA